MLRRHGYETYLDVILSGPASEGESQAELLDALRARRMAEETVAALRAAAEPPAIVNALRSRRDRIRREAADILGCDPGENVADLLHAHPAVPTSRTRQLAIELSNLGVHPVGVSVREAAAGVLDDQDDELAARDDARGEIERLERELVSLDEADERADEHAQRVQEMAEATNADVVEAAARVQLLESELVDRASQDERRLQRIAAAEQLRSQITAVTDALNHSNEEYHSALADAERSVIEAELEVERSSSATAEARQRMRRISDALPPPLRPRPADDPLVELPNLRETLTAEVERAEGALDEANDELDEVEADIARTQGELDAHLEVVPTEDIGRRRPRRRRGRPGRHRHHPGRPRRPLRPVARRARRPPRPAGGRLGHPPGRPPHRRSRHAGLGDRPARRRRHRDTTSHADRVLWGPGAAPVAAHPGPLG